MGDLIAFLNARLDEDEQAARSATPGPWWHNPGKQWLDPEAFERYDLTRGEEFVGYGGPSPFTGAVAATGPTSHPQSMADAAFIAGHNPARVLTEVEAKRRILKEYEAASAYYGENRAAPAGELHGLLTAIKLLALPYADMEGYQEEWRP